MIELRSFAEIEAMRPAGRFVVEVLAELAPRVNLFELDGLAHDLIRERSATSCYIDYHPSFGAMPFGDDPRQTARYSFGEMPIRR